VGTKGPFGYSVTGLIVHSLSGNGEVTKYDKNFGKNLKSEEVALVPKRFFDLESRFVPELVDIILEQMCQVWTGYESYKRK
jgi:hypothetical protein